MVEKVYDLIARNVALPDGTPVRVVGAHEIVYGARRHRRRDEGAVHIVADARKGDVTQCE